jgi:hypothetical protein
MESSIPSLFYVPFCLHPVDMTLSALQTAAAALEARIAEMENIFDSHAYPADTSLRGRVRLVESRLHKAQRQLGVDGGTLRRIADLATLPSCPESKAALVVEQTELLVRACATAGNLGRKAEQALDQPSQGTFAALAPRIDACCRRQEAIDAAVALGLDSIMSALARYRTLALSAGSDASSPFGVML